MSASAETSRRALLFGAAGGVAALLAQALGRPAAVHAEGEAVMVGGDYGDATSTTHIANQQNSETVIKGTSLAGGIGVAGFSSSNHGVEGMSNSYVGVHGVSTSSIAVFGESTQSTGVHGSGSRYGGSFDGGLAQLRLVPKQSLGKPTTGAHLAGEFYVDSKARLFVCTAAGTPGTWKRVLTKLA